MNNSYVVTPLRRIHLAQGDVMTGLKASDERYMGFGELYFTQALKGKPKAWKLHRTTVANIIVPTGRVLFVILDGSGHRRVQHKCVLLGDGEDKCLTINPGVVFGFMGLNILPSIVANVIDRPYSTSENETLGLDYYSFSWIDYI